MPTTPHIFVQTVHTRWTKKSRGSPGSAARNATPEVVDLPHAVSQVRTVIAWHDVVFDEARSFQRHDACRERPAMPAQFNWVDVAEGTGRVVGVALLGRRRFTLRDRETGNIVYNLAEDVDADGWRSTLYHKVSFHISVGLTWDARLFYRPPTHALRSLRVLA